MLVHEGRVVNADDLVMKLVKAARATIATRQPGWVADDYSEEFYKPFQEILRDVQIDTRGDWKAASEAWCYCPPNFCVGGRADKCREKAASSRLEMLPNGWRLVPAEPSETMLRVGRGSVDWNDDMTNEAIDTLIAAVYRAMLFASPAPIQRQAGQS